MGRRRLHDALELRDTDCSLLLELHSVIIMPIEDEGGLLRSRLFPGKCSDLLATAARRIIIQRRENKDE